MRYVATLLFVLLSVGADGAFAQDPGGKMPMNPCMKKQMMEKKMHFHQEKGKLVEEERALLLDTIRLLKEVAADPALQKRAEELETRMQAVIEANKSLMEEMMRIRSMRHGSHSGSSPK